MVLVWMLGANFTLQAVIATVLSVHLLTILQRFGLELGAAVALGTLVGPSQVGGRLLEVAFGRYFHPVWTAVAASLFVFGGLTLLLVVPPVVMAGALVLYGAGNGVHNPIVKGTLPWPSSVRPAMPHSWDASPCRRSSPKPWRQPLIAFTLAGSGPDRLVAILAALALLNVLLSYALRLASPRDEQASQKA